MIKRYFIMAIAAAFALVACTKNFDEPGMEIQPAGSENVHTLSVGIEAGSYVPVDGQTKASTEAVIHVKWEEGDKISVVNASTGKILGGCLTADETGESVTFSGTVTGTIEQTDQLYYVYPRIVDNAEAVDFDEAGYDISLANQTYNGSDIGKVRFYGYAEDNLSSNFVSKKIKFNLVTSYAHLNMAGLPAKGADLNTLDVSNVNEGFTWTLNGSLLKVEPYAGSNSISVSCTNTKITQAGNAVVRFAIPASAATEQARVLTVNKAYKNDGYVKAELKSSSYYNQLYTIWVSSNVEVEDKGTEVKVQIDNAGSAEAAEGILPVEEAFKSGKTDGTSIQMGGVGTITFDQTATEKILENAENAGSTNVFFKIEDVTEDEDVQVKNIVYEVTMKTVDEQGVEVFSTEKAAGVATVVVPLGDNVLSVESVSLLDENGQSITGGVQSYVFDVSTRVLTIKVVHFSKYAIKYIERTQEIDAVALIGERKYETLEAAVAAVQKGQTITLVKDVELENPIVTDKTFTLTLNKNITPVSTWVGGSDKDGVIIIKRGGNLTINGTGKILNGNVEKAYAAVKMTQNGETENGSAAKLTVDGEVTLEGYYYGIVGNGSRHNTEIIVNGGTIKGYKEDDCQGIYHPQDGKLTINGGEISGYNSAIEVRGGTVEINGGTLTSTASPLKIDPNGSGSTTNGAALAIAQHTTKKDIKVTVNGGTLKGYKAIAIKDAQNNGTENVTVTYKAGTLNGGLTLGHGTFNLAGNLAVKEPVKVIGKTTLDLGTSKLSAAEGFTRPSAGVIIINRKGDLTVKGTTGSIESDGNVYSVVTLTEKDVDTGDTSNPAKLTVDSGSLIGRYYAISGNGSAGRENTAIVINGGTVKTGEEGGAAIYHPQNGTLTINGGTIESATGIYVKSGSVTTEVAGGTIKGIGPKEDYEASSSGMQSTGDAIVFDNCDYPGGAPNADIKGGNFFSANAKAVGSYAKTGKDPITGFISGGLFSSEPAAELIVAGKAAIENTDSATSEQYPWTIGERPNVAKIGDTEYATLAEAFAAVPENGTEATTITIINNANDTFESCGAKLENGKKVILDLNGYKLVGTSTKSGYTQYIYVENGCELTVKDSRTGGAIEYHDSYIENLTSGKSTGGSTITCHGCMTLESGTIENKTPDTNTGDLEGAIDMYTNAWGQAYSPADIVLTINGGVVKSNNANTIRMTSFSSQSYTTSVIANMNGGEVYGRDGFFIQGVSESYLNTNTLNLNGGKVYGTQAVRVMAFQNHENALTSKPVTIKIGEGVDLKNNYYAQSPKTCWCKNICIDNLSGTYEQLLSYVNIIDGVAQIVGSEDTYGSVSDAIKAAADGATIKLLKNLNNSVCIETYDQYKKSFTLDLNGKSLTASDSPLRLDNLNYLNNDGEQNKAIILTGNGIVTATGNLYEGLIAPVHLAASGTTLNIENGTYTVNAGQRVLYNYQAYCTINVNGGTFVGDIEHYKGNTIINAGSFTGNVRMVNKGTMTINGGEVTGDVVFEEENKAKNISGAYGATLIINDGTVGSILFKNATCTAQISGGIIKGSIVDDGWMKSNISISGGKFKVKPDTSYLATGATCSEETDENGYYVVTSNN